MWKTLAPVLLEAAANRQGPGGAGSSNLVLCNNRHPAYNFPQRSNPQSLPEGQLSSPLTQCVWTFFWLAMLLFVAYPIALITCIIYIILSPIGAFCSCFLKFTDFLLKLTHLPLVCAHNMIQAKALIHM